RLVVSSRRRHTRFSRDWSSDVCSSDLQNKAVFEAIDGLHHAIIENDLIKLQMQDVLSIENHEHYVFLNTGSPHHVQLEANLKERSEERRVGNGCRRMRLWTDSRR